jgi:DNA helicase-2/ATP-dependent DNA helicase PcrA
MQSMQEPKRLEEERRLAYVGITRARRQLFLSHAEKRHLHGREIYPRPSRFLAEIPAELTRDVRTGTTVHLTHPRRPGAVESETGEVLYPGQRVRHRSFGEGIVQTVEGQGEHARVQVRFEQTGAKWLILSYANLELI